jgi:hypothetical protein
MMYFTMDSFPDAGGWWKESRLSLSHLAHLPTKTRALAGLQDIVRRGR